MGKLGCGYILDPSGTSLGSEDRATHFAVAIRAGV
jgi:hypothetical protein